MHDAPNHEVAELDYDGVIAALEAFEGDYVRVSIDDAETTMGTIAAVAGVLGPGNPQETMEAGIEGVVFIVGDRPKSYHRGPSTFAVWRKPFQVGLRMGDRLEYRMGSVAVVVDRQPRTPEARNDT